MVEVSCLVAHECRVDDQISSLNSEHETISESFHLVLVLSDVRDRDPDDLADILDHELVFQEVFASKQT